MPKCICLKITGIGALLFILKLKTEIFRSIGVKKFNTIVKKINRRVMFPASKQMLNI